MTAQQEKPRTHLGGVISDARYAVLQQCESLQSAMQAAPLPACLSTVRKTCADQNSRAAVEAWQGCIISENIGVRACVKALLDCLPFALVQAFSVSGLQPSMLASAPLTVGMGGSSSPTSGATSHVVEQLTPSSPLPRQLRSPCDLFLGSSAPRIVCVVSRIHRIR